ncbi:branched chain amino acid aminotransferase, partial [Lachnotalea glycerini]
MLDIKFEKSTYLKPIPDENNPLVFGTIFTDHMFVMDYETGKGWHSARVTEYAPISLEPSAMVFHYGQEMFEGLKAYKTQDERILLFRPDKNIERANNTNRRICIPEIPKEDFLQAIQAIVSADRKWIPTKPGTSLYIRPFI